MPTLKTSRYVKPASYVGPIARTKAGSLSGVPRLPQIVAIGSRLAESRNAQILRSYVADEELTFPNNAPYLATIDFLADGDQSKAVLINVRTGTEVPNNKWSFQKSDQAFLGYNQILIVAEQFDFTASYQLSYQSVSRSVKDPLPVTDIRRVGAVGLQTDSQQFEEGTDFVIPMAVGEPTAVVDADGNNTYILGEIVSTVENTVKTGDGTIASVVPTDDYAHKYNRTYILTCLSITPGAAEGNDRYALFEWSATDRSNGLEAKPFSPFVTKTGSNFPKTQVLIQAAAGQATTVVDELTATFSFGGDVAQNFAVGDTFTFEIYGPSLVEVPGRYSNTNQFHEISSIAKSRADSPTITVAVDSDEATSVVENRKYKARVIENAKAKVQTGVGNAGLVWTAKNVGSLLMSSDAPQLPIQVVVTTNVANEISISTYISTDKRIIDVKLASGGSTAGAVKTTAEGQGSAVSSFVSVAFPTISDPGGVGDGSGTMLTTQESYVKTGSGGDNNEIVWVPVPSPGILAIIGETSQTPITVEILNNANADGLLAVAIALRKVTVTRAGANRPASENAASAVIAAVNADAQTLVIPEGGAGDETGVVVAAAEFQIHPNPVSSAASSKRLAWQRYGEDRTSSAIETASLSAGTVTLEDGVIVTLVDGTYSVGDTYTFLLNAPKIHPVFKDARTYKLRINSGTGETGENAGTKTALVKASYTTTTPEGSFGVLNVAEATSAEMQALLPGNMILYFRNATGALDGAIRYTTTSHNNKGDLFTWAVTSDNVIDWNLEAEVEETILASNLLYDLLGLVTGTADTYYVILNKIPVSILSVKQNGGEPTDITKTNIVKTSSGENTNYLWWESGDISTTKSTIVKYRHRGAEPDPGAYYYFTSEYLRPRSLYNTPRRFLSVDEARNALRPMEKRNDALIAAEIMFEYSPPGIYVTQVYDSDQDGQYHPTDFKAAIEEAAKVSGATDLILLDGFEAWGDALRALDKRNDPFEAKETMGWFGAPRDTPIGSVDEAGSLIYLSKRTLQVYGNSPARGTRILHAATTCKRSIVMPDGTIAQVEKDGSFVAAAMAAYTASFQDPGDTLLRKRLASFDEIQVYEEAQDLFLGGSNIIYFKKLGPGIYRIEEDMTVDITGEEFSIISAMVQKHHVQRVVREETDAALISVVPSSEQAGIAQVQGVVVSSLLGLLSRGIVGAYQDDQGNERPLNPDKDVLVFRDATRKTLYHFNFAFWLRYPLKYAFGLYSVDSNDFGRR